jgi:hypothetical protein
MIRVRRRGTTQSTPLLLLVCWCWRPAGALGRRRQLDRRDQGRNRPIIGHPFHARTDQRAHRQRVRRRQGESGQYQRRHRETERPGSQEANLHQGDGQGTRQGRRQRLRLWRRRHSDHRALRSKRRAQRRAQGLRGSGDWQLDRRQGRLRGGEEIARPHIGRSHTPT